MAAERLPMRKTREILRQKWELGRSHREVARSLGVSLGVVSLAVSRAREAGFERFEDVAALGEAELEGRLYRREGVPASAERAEPDYTTIHTEPASPRGDARAASSGVLGATPGRVPLQPVLRAVSALGGSATPDDAPGAQGGREGVHGLRGEEAARGRRGHGRARGDGALRGRARGVELHVCRGDADTDLGGLRGEPPKGARVFRRRAGAPRPRSAPLGGVRPVPLRAGDPADLRGIRRALRVRPVDLYAALAEVAR
jgi:hypothetical protein